MTTIQSTQGPTTNACEDVGETGAASKSTPASQAASSTVEAATKGAVHGGASHAQTSADLHLLSKNRRDAINLTPDEQWAEYDSLMDQYKDKLAEYNAQNGVWKDYADACAAIDAANAQVPAQNQQLDEQIASTGEELAALTTLNNFMHTAQLINGDGVITLGELLDMAHGTACDFFGTALTNLSQDVIDAAKYFEAHMDQWNQISCNGTLSQGDAAKGVSDLTKLYNELPKQKKTIQAHPAPPPGTKPTPPKKPVMPSTPRPGSSKASSSSEGEGTAGTKGASDTKDSTGTKGASDAKNGSDTKTPKASTDKGPKIAQKDKSGEGGIEGAMTHAQDRMDQIQDRLAWVEDEIGRLETKSPLSPEERQQLTDLRAEKTRLTRALQSASEAYTAMMTLITNMMKMYADMQKAIINNMR